MMRHPTKVLSAIICLMMLLVGPAFGQQKDLSENIETKQIKVIGTNNPLPSLLENAQRSRENPPIDMMLDIPNFAFDSRPDTRAMKQGETLGPDEVLRPYAPTILTDVMTRFDGADNTDQGFFVTPPDPNGEVSGDDVDRFVQMINVVTTVYDKDGNEQGGGPFFANAFWAGFGGLCETTNRGDPIVLYDEEAKRWIVTQFAFTDITGPTYLQCVAVSQTSDPLGAYNRYAFDFSEIGFNDYPKHGITGDALTLTANLFIPPTLAFGGTFFGATDKSCIYSGAPTCSLDGFVFVGGEMIVDYDDPNGTAGDVPELFSLLAFSGGQPVFVVIKLAPDFQSFNFVDNIISIPNYESTICNAFRGRCIPHPGGSVIGNDDLESLAGRLMHKTQLRDFGTHLSMVATHTIDAENAPAAVLGRAGVRWYEFRSFDRGETWSLYQSGTHAPDDGLHRFMGSIAMNAAGDIGIGYMVSDATQPVEIRVTGQTADMSGTGVFNSSEGICREGVAGADWTGRSGDYSATSIDPDRDTFWHTSEFGRSTDFRGWGTAVCEFALKPEAIESDELIISAYSGAPANGQYVDVTNVSGDYVMLTGKALNTFNVFTETAVGDASVALTGIIGPGDTYRIGSAGAPNVDQVIPDGALPAGPGSLGLFNGAPLADGSPFTTAGQVTGMVYINNMMVFGISHTTLPALNSFYDCIYGGSGTGPFMAPFTPVEECFEAEKSAVANYEASSMIDMMRAAAEFSETVASDTPGQFVLDANYPNPFNPQTVIRFSVPEASAVTLTVYDLLGRSVRVLLDGEVSAGWHEANFDASGLPSGMYLYRLETPAFSQQRTMVLTK